MIKRQYKTRHTRSTNQTFLWFKQGRPSAASSTLARFLGGKHACSRAHKDILPGWALMVLVRGGKEFELTLFSWSKKEYRWHYAFSMKSGVHIIWRHIQDHTMEKGLTNSWSRVFSFDVLKSLACDKSNLQWTVLLSTVKYHDDENNRDADDAELPVVFAASLTHLWSPELQSVY